MLLEKVDLHLGQMKISRSLDDANDPQTEAFEIDAPSTEQIKSFSAKLILKTRETRKLTRTAMQGVIEDVVTFVSGTVESQTRAVLHANGVNLESISGLKEVFSGAATTPFKDLLSSCSTVENTLTLL